MDRAAKAWGRPRKSTLDPVRTGSEPTHVHLARKHVASAWSSFLIWISGKDILLCASHLESHNQGIGGGKKLSCLTRGVARRKTALGHVCFLNSSLLPNKSILTLLLLMWKDFAKRISAKRVGGQCFLTCKSVAMKCIWSWLYHALPGYFVVPLLYGCVCCVASLDCVFDCWCLLRLSQFSADITLLHLPCEPAAGIWRFLCLDWHFLKEYATLK